PLATLPPLPLSAAAPGVGRTDPGPRRHTICRSSPSGKRWRHEARTFPRRPARAPAMTTSRRSPNNASGPEKTGHEVTHGLLERFGLARPLRHVPKRLLAAAFMFAAGFLTIALLAVVAMVSMTPLVFPSLGPTAFLFFFRPTAPAASPRNTLYGHALGILCG